MKQALFIPKPGQVVKLGLLFILFLFLTKPEFTTQSSRDDMNLPAPYLLGVVRDTGTHEADLWGRGVRAISFELKWKFYEPQEGIYDQAYIDHMKQLLAQFNAQGWYIQLIPGFHYTPEWVFTNYPNMQYINQYGETYNPDPVSAGDFRVINAPFNPQARSLISGYLARIFQDFDQGNSAYQFDAVRVGGGVQGELRYPPGIWNGHTNSYWAFDASAQNNAISGMPHDVAGWRPGVDPNPGTTGSGQLLINPGFEQTHAYFDTPAWSPDDEVHTEIITTDRHAGDSALKIILTSANRVHQYVKVTANTGYELGGWLKSSNISRRARLFATQYNAAWQPVSGAPFLKLESTSLSWSPVSGTITTGSGTAFLKIELDGDQTGVYYFDDLRLHKSGETNMQDRSADIPLAFYDWYLQKLIDYQNWQIDEIRKYFSGQLDIVVAGKGVRPVQITDAVNNDLAGDGWSEAGSALYAGADYARIFAATTRSQPIAVYLTGVEDPAVSMIDDRSPYPGSWSAARWLALISRNNGFLIWGENTGQNTYAQMQLSFERMRANGFFGLMWAFESNLYSSTPAYATADQYQSLIEIYSNLFQTYLPLANRGN